MTTINSAKLATIDLNLLVAFDALFTERHVTRAAARMGLTQSAMSHALRRLRVLFDDPLFARVPRGILPTERAVELSVAVRRILADVERTVSDGARFEPERAERTFTLVASDYASMILLPPLVRHLAQSAPGIAISVRAGLQNWAVPLEEGRVDLVIGIFDSELPSAYRQQILQERFVCVVRADHPEVGDELTLEQFVRLPHALISPRGISIGGYVDDELARLNLRRRVVITVPHFLVAPHVVAGTDVILTVAERIALQLADKLGLRIVKPPLDIPGFQLNQYWHERQHHDPGHTWLREQIAQVCREA
ncbi:LysR family transcriptional regulator [Chondromyces apiculatus]|uniref:Transcriptional regulator, LysR family n=1 Tax=Chondromyces apiculatus DSM 436 TaxID=1192034 RepID=A0A017T777_9BACT|nr:LysR family transcriptional regulator [Chondromyces apiculatus]EYF05059.1 Transcriptional regulator, LysR family [Chondromyces apiculatus DSM 436]